MFTIGELASIRDALKRGTRMATLCAFMPAHSRDEIVEAIDQLHRNVSLHDAQRHVNQVLAYQAAQIPLINGKPVNEIRTRYAGMF